MASDCKPGRLRRLSARLAQQLVFISSKTLRRDEIASAPALVFVPHPDDETLGCGGSVMIKTAANTDVSIVYMTDGGAAKYNDLDMVSVRKSEALAACEVLGVGADDVEFLDFPDGRLADCEAEGVDAVEKILEHHQDYAVYVPAKDDGHPDHEATTEFVAQACRRSGRRITYEYPVWRWNQYPFTQPSDCGLGCKAHQVKDFFRYFVLDSTVKLPISDKLTGKNKALNQHVSQMTNEYYPANITLNDIGEGDWLACLMADYEVFKRVG